MKQMQQHTAKKILLVKPVKFFKNPETATNNFFQMDLDKNNQSEGKISELAQAEFDLFAKTLEKNHIETIIWNCKSEETPDAIFPNNWLVTRPDHSINLMPMFAKNRRKERDWRLINFLKTKHRYKTIKDFTSFERREKYFEGTGSAVFHHPSKTAYVSLSGRADRDTARAIMSDFGYKTVTFQGKQTVNGLRRPIYHTNVLLSVGERFVVVCLDSIDNKNDRRRLIESFKGNKLEIIEISEIQMNQFCGNILQVSNSRGQKKIIMSSKSFRGFHKHQLAKLEQHGTIIRSPLDLIEKLGGGGARCMMAELY